MADACVDNDGTHEELAARVAALWDERLGPFEENLQADRAVQRDHSRIVTLHEHRDEWGLQAGRIIARIRHQMDTAGIPYAGVDHIGSTAIPGLLAKDVIDLQLRVPRLAEADDRFGDALRAAGVVGLCASRDQPHTWAPDPADWRKLFAGGADPKDAGSFALFHGQSEKRP